jgi:hypothetical protein
MGSHFQRSGSARTQDAIGSVCRQKIKPCYKPISYQDNGWMKHLASVVHIHLGIDLDPHQYPQIHCRLICCNTKEKRTAGTATLLHNQSVSQQGNCDYYKTICGITSSLIRLPAPFRIQPHSIFQPFSDMDITCGLHISYVFRSKHMPMVMESSSPFPSVTQWFLPCQLLGNLSTDASGA